MVEFFDFGNSSVVFLSDSAQVVAFTDTVVGDGGLGFRGCGLCRVFLDRRRCGNAVTGHIHSVIFQFVVGEIHQSVWVDVLSQITDLEVQV